jgi:hypothetical protein
MATHWAKQLSLSTIIQKTYSHKMLNISPMAVKTYPLIMGTIMNLKDIHTKHRHRVTNKPPLQANL